MAIKNKETKEDVTKFLDEFLLTGSEKDFAHDALNKFLDRVRKNIDENDFNASGNLRQSLSVLPTRREGDRIICTITIEDYWKDLEEGTKPKGFNKANFKALQPKILEWIKNKESLSTIANTEWRKRAFSYLITRSILKKGTIKRFGYKGKPFLTSEIPKLEKDIIKEFEP